MICERISIQTENSAKDTHLDTYILEDFLDGGPKWKRPLVLICPGGAYARTSNREAEPIALQMTAMGYHAAVLRYSCVPAVYPTALHEVALSVKYLSDRAQQWHIDTDKILVMGFSAGGTSGSQLRGLLAGRTYGRGGGLFFRRAPASGADPLLSGD